MILSMHHAKGIRKVSKQNGIAPNWGYYMGVCAFAGISFSAHAQVESTVMGGKVGAGNAVDTTAAALSGELTTSKVINDPGAPYENVFQNFNLALGLNPKLGPGYIYANAGPVNLGTGVITPISRGFQPESAELKIGNFYLDVNYLSGSLIYTDNVNLTQNNRKDEVASAILLGLTGVYQLTEGLRVSVSGALIWLPLDGKFGVAGFGLNDPYARFALDGQALFSAGASYDFTLGGWDVRVFDDFRVNNRSIYGVGDDGAVDLYDGESFNENNGFRNQRLYSFQTSGNQGNGRQLVNSSRFDSENTDIVNRAGIVGTRMLPTETRATLSYTHDDYWNLATSSVPGAANPRTLDTFRTFLNSERENLRFKPYAFYIAQKNDQQSGWDQIVAGGLRGPVTENIFFDGGAGYVFSGNTSNTELLWFLRLNHEINPTTSQSVVYSRELTQPDRILTQSLRYQLTKILGPYVTSGIYAQRQELEDLDNGNSLAITHEAGAFIRFQFDQYGQLEFQGFYRQYDFENPATADYSLSTLRAIYTRKFTDTVFGEFFYQFEQRDSKAAGQDYYENLVAMRLIKYF